MCVCDLYTVSYIYISVSVFVCLFAKSHEFALIPFREVLTCAVSYSS